MASIHISDISLDMCAPTAELLPLLSAILADDAPELPSAYLASSMLMRHRFLGLTPEDPRYFQSRDVTEVSEAFEQLRNLGSSEWQLSPVTWRAAPSELGNAGLNLFARVVVAPSDPGLQSDGLAIIFSYEPASTTLTPAAGDREHQLVWKYYDMVAPVSFEAWHDAPRKAVEDLPLRFRQSHSDLDDEQDDGQIDAPEMSAEDFWEGANSDSSGGSMIDELEASTQRLRLDSSLDSSLPLPRRDSPTSANFKHSSAPPSPTNMHSPPSIVLSPPAPFYDLHSSQPQPPHHLSLKGNSLQTLPPASADAVASAHVFPEEINSLKSTIKGILDLWARAGSSNLDQQLSRLQVFEEVAQRAARDYEEDLHGQNGR